MQDICRICGYMQDIWIYICRICGESFSNMESWLRVGILFVGYPSSIPPLGPSWGVLPKYFCEMCCLNIFVRFVAQIFLWDLLPKYFCEICCLNIFRWSYQSRIIAQAWSDKIIFVKILVPKSHNYKHTLTVLESLNVCQWQGIHQYNPRIPKPSVSLSLCVMLWTPLSPSVQCFEHNNYAPTDVVCWEQYYSLYI